MWDTFCYIISSDTFTLFHEFNNAVVTKTFPLSNPFFWNSIPFYPSNVTLLNHELLPQCYIYFWPKEEKMYWKFTPSCSASIKWINTVIPSSQVTTHIHIQITGSLMSAKVLNNKWITIHRHEYKKNPMVQMNELHFFCLTEVFPSTSVGFIASSGVQWRWKIDRVFVVTALVWGLEFSVIRNMGKCCWEQLLRCVVLYFLSLYVYFLYILF